MPNRLAKETSPYLLQHKDNPVDWYPWGDEALKRAKAEGKPIFLSIGYSACHWCHVMEHESFENRDIAALMNKHFVNIKVDREERPDLDQIYMNAVQIMTRHGGWPMSVFLTPEGKPFYGGTYWPPEPRMGMPGFRQVLVGVAEAWRDRREQVVGQAERLTGELEEIATVSTAGEVSPELAQTALARLEQDFDFANGGFGHQPKFPHAMALQFVLRMWRRSGHEDLLRMVRLNLDKMAAGGIYDHLAGGFARYSVDAYWLVPHFEKMLYDNSLLAAAYLDGYLATGDERYAATVHETLRYVLDYMQDDAGGFHSSEDADSEGEEGKFYVWSPDEIRRVLGAEAGERFCYVYDVTDEGNFEGHSILNLPKSIEDCAKLKGWDADELKTELVQSRRRLLEVRDHRVRPGKDDKVLVSWNALMINALARAAAVFQRTEYLDAATAAAEFIFREMCRKDGRLLHSWRGGQARLDAYLDDYAFLADALVSLYEAGFDERWIARAVSLADVMIEHFSDKDGGGFFFTADDHEDLITRNKDFYESSIPSGNAQAAMVLIRLGKLCGRSDYLQAAGATIAEAARIMERAASAAGQMLCAADMWLGPFHELVFVGDGSTTDNLLANVHRDYRPNRVVARRAGNARGSCKHLDGLFAGRQAIDGIEPVLYICEDFQCQQPAVGAKAAREALAALDRP